MKKKLLAICIMLISGINLVNVYGQIKEPRVIWDCIWFGTYPQAEYNDTARLTNKKYFNDTKGERCGYVAKGKNGETVKIGTVYNTDAKAMLVSLNRNKDLTGANLSFKYEPIKWRILKVDGNKALLLSDKIIDQYYAYNPSFTDGSIYYTGIQMDFVWRNTKLRNYMNQYMYEIAFSADEQAAILDSKVTSDFTYKQEKDVTVDKLFILSYDELAKNYGFDTSKSLLCEISDYGRASGTGRYDSYGKYGTYYSLTDGYQSENIYGDGTTKYAFCSASINAISNTGVLKRVDALNYNGIRVAMWVDLTKCKYQYAGTVSSDGTENEVQYVYPVNLTKVKIKSATNIKKRAVRIKFQKVKNAKQYKIQYAKNRKFKKAKTKISKNTIVKIKKLRKGKTYYIRVRAINGKKQGKWSKVRKVKIKR